jgi:hypothetical protein
VLAIEAAFEAGDFLGFIGLAAAAAWAVWVVAGARAIGLPGGRGHPAAETYPLASMVIALLMLIAGPALALLQSGYANPVAVEVMRSQSTALGGGLTSVVTTSSLLPAVTLFTPLLVIAIAVYFATNTKAIRTQARPALFAVPRVELVQRLRETLRSATVPEEYRSIFNLRELESAAARGNPIVWLVALVALGFAVTRF